MPSPLAELTSTPRTRAEADALLKRVLSEYLNGEVTTEWGANGSVLVVLPTRILSIRKKRAIDKAVARVASMVVVLRADITEADIIDSMKQLRNGS